jgi:hypothetical protein
MTCYEVCDCECGDEDELFDRIRTSETNFAPTLYDLCHSNIGWYNDKSLCDAHLGAFGLSRALGVYVLWHKDGYCAEHDMFHMRALYVGKGALHSRLYDHYRRKDFSKELLVYWTYLELPNRIAKYYEQLILDTYALPKNKQESTGDAQLCAHFTQAQAD